MATLIKELNDTIKAIKPWVRFGISPFGIHRNLKDTPDGSGSKTNGLSNYEQLFADIPHWLNNGWVDYNVPQIYWKIGHPAADYKTLIEWWSAGNFGRHLYIGQNISTFREPDLENPGRSQFRTKMELTRTLPNVHGNVWWPGWTLNSNPNGFTDSLAINYQRSIALVPVYNFLDSIAPEPVSFTRIRGGKLEWGHNYKISKGDKLQEPQFFAIYRFPEGAEINIENSNYLFKIVQGNSLILTKQNGKKNKYKYLVTAIDRCRNESIPGRAISSSY